MAAYTASVTGNWSNAATFGGAGVPGNGDTVTVNSGVVVTVDQTATVGTSGASGTAAVTINGTGKLVVAATLVVRGDLLLGATSTSRTAGFYQLTVNAGAVLEFDASQAASPSATTYVCGPTQSNSPDARVWLGGSANAGDTAGKLPATTGGNHATVRSNAGGANGRFSIRGFNTRLGSVTATYTDFLRIGDASNAAFDMYLSSGTAEPDTFSLSDCTFAACGTLTSTVAVNAAAVFSVVRCGWSNTVAATCTTVSANTALTTGTRLFQRCYFDQQFGNSTNVCGFTLDACVLAGSWLITASATLPWASVQDCLVRKTAAGTAANQVGGGAQCGGPVSRVYYLTDNTTSTNNKWWTNPTGYDATLDGGHWESLSTLDNTGDFFSVVNAPASLRTYTLTHHTVGFSPGTQDRPGTRWSVASSTANIACVDRHNTWIAGAEPAFSIGETASSPAGVVTAFQDNITYGPMTPQGGSQYHARDLAATGATTDTFVPAGITNNCGFGLKTGSAGSGFQLTQSVAPGGSNLVGVDPRFVDTTRTLAAWDLSLGGAGTTAGALARFAADPSLVPTAYSWVRAGWAPRNSALRNAGHDGTDIGAVPGVFPAPMLTLLGVG